jgi:uncharacterized protein (DUF302 family)
MVLEWFSPLKLTDIEPLIQRAAQRRMASISSVEPTGAAILFTLLKPDLYAQLLSAEIRFAVFLPCRIAAYEQGGGVKIAVLSPAEFARVFHSPEIDALAAALETLVKEIVTDVTRSTSSAVGATEDQMNMRGTVGQRTDSSGSKIEDLAGTGEQDSPGG